MTKIPHLPKRRALMGRLFLLFSTAMLVATLSAEQYDRLLEAIHIPKGAYFNTGCVITDTPRVVARISPDSTATFDLFAVKTRSVGCWILNLENGKFYYRYGTSGNGGAKGAYTAGQYLEINCGKSLVVNGSSLQTASDYDFSANTYEMTIPGTAYLGALTIMSWLLIIRATDEFVATSPVAQYIPLILVLIHFVIRRKVLNLLPCFVTTVVASALFYLVLVLIPVTGYGCCGANMFYLGANVFAFTVFSVQYRLRPLLKAGDRCVVDFLHIDVDGAIGGERNVSAGGVEGNAVDVGSLHC